MGYNRARWEGGLTKAHAPIGVKAMRIRGIVIGYVPCYTGRFANTPGNAIKGGLMYPPTDEGRQAALAFVANLRRDSADSNLSSILVDED